MALVRIIRLLATLLLSFIALCYMLFCIGIYTHEPGVSGRLVNCLFASLPFLFTFWLVYRSFRRDEMLEREFLWCTICPAALLSAFLAELCLLLALLTGYFLLLS